MPDAFICRMVGNKEMLYHHCFSALLWNVPLGMCKKAEELELNENISFWLC
jgi:hypothetical protein